MAAASNKLPLRFAIAGAGMLFRNGYSPWIGGFLKANKSKYRLCAICDPDIDKTRRYSLDFSSRAYPDFEEMLSAEHPYAVIINTPHWLHESQTIAAANAGASVLCEKPMAPTTAACAGMVEICERANVHLQTGFMRRFIPGFQLIRNIISKGELGKILDIEVDWPYFIPDISAAPFKQIIAGVEQVTGVNIPDKFGAWRLKDNRSGGGIFLDHAPHIVDLFRFWNGEIDKVLAGINSTIPGENDDHARCVTHFQNGALGFITTTLRDPKGNLLGEIKGFIRGEKGRIDFTLPNPTFFAQLRKIEISKEPTGAAGRLIYLAGLRKKEIKFGPYNAFRDQLEYFLGTCAGSRQPHKLFGLEPFAADGKDGLIATGIVEAAYKSSASNNSWIPASPE